MTIDEYIKEQRERVANMTLAQARQIVADHYGHDDERIECEKAVKMLLNCADEKINGGWIPVTEKLPEYSKEVLTCSNYGFIEIQSLEKLCNKYWEDQKGDRSDFDEVISWMPLPQPYKAESEK